MPRSPATGRGDAMAAKITADVVEDYLNCEYKAHLRLSGRQGTKSEYEVMRLGSRREVRLGAINEILARYPANAVEQGVVLSPSALSRGAPFILDAEREDDQFLVHFDGLKKVDRRSDLGDFHYVPVLYYEGRQIRKPQRLLLEVLGLILSRVQGRAPDRGVIYHGRKCAATTVRLTPGLKAAEDLQGEITRRRAGEASPKLLLNDHCQACEFRQQCHARAVAEDNLSLLRGLGEKETKGYPRKGLFTLTQLAHTFRPAGRGSARTAAASTGITRSRRWRSATSGCTCSARRRCRPGRCGSIWTWRACRKTGSST
jgi:predicted RecB family nuclease